MKKTSLYSTKKYMFLGALVLIIFSISACSRKTSFMTSSVVPAARGEVKVKKDDNQNYNIKVKLSDLAEVKRLDPSKETYVVWMISEEGNTENLGQLNSSKSMFSNNLKGSLETISSTKPSKIFVTAENDAGAQYPDDQIIMSTESF